MVSRLHQRLGTAGFVLSIVALIAALAGGAYAAGGLTSAEKKQITKESKKFSKQFSKQFAKAGPAGPAGPQGAKGDAGAPGKNGTNGTNGTNGADGTDGADGEDGACSAGDPSCVVPSDGTLVGAWGTSGGEAGGVKDISLVQISFGLQVSPAPTAVYAYNQIPGFKLGTQLEDGSTKFFGPNPAPGSEAEAIEDQEAYEDACPGTVDAPEAAPGFLCIYEGTKTGTVFAPQATPSAVEAANEFGLVVPFSVGENGSLRGSWAVTAE